MKIEFKDVETGEDGCIWYDLYVKTDDRDWHRAVDVYFTSDEESIKTIIYQSKNCNAIVKNFNEYIEQYKLPISCFEPMENLCDYDSPWGVINGGVTILANMDFTNFEVGFETYDSGSYWEPPSMDYNEHSNEKTIMDALMEAFKLSMEDSYNMWNLDNWESHEPVIEEERYDDLYDETTWKNSL